MQCGLRVLGVAALLVSALAGSSFAGATYSESLSAGDQAQQVGDAGAALREFKAALGQSSNDTERALALSKTAYVYCYTQKKFGEARSTANEALAIEGAAPIGHVSALEVLARCQMAEKDYAGASATIDRALALPGVEWAKPGLALMLGDCARFTGSPTRAIKAYASVMDMPGAYDGVKGVAQLNLGLTYQYSMQRMEEARAAYEKAKALNPGLSGEIDAHLGEMTPADTTGAAPLPPLAAWDHDAPKTLLMHYMPWYTAPASKGGRGQWGGHWTGWEKQHDPDTVDGKGMPDIWSHYHPLIGLYDSTDPDVLECQLLQMKLAGINGVIADWYGISPVNDYPEIHQATEALFEATGETGMSFAACFEDRTYQAIVEGGAMTSDEIPAHLTKTIEWMQSNWFDKPQYVKIGDRPLLMDFGPIYVKDVKAWDGALGSVSPRPAFFALHHLWKSVDADGGFTWVHQGVWEGNPSPEEINERLEDEYTHSSSDPRKIIVSALPGFHDVYEHSYGRLDHRDGRTMRESIEFCLDGPWPLVQLVTWNDYGEGTVIEPTHEFGYQFLEIIQDARRNEIGSSFTFTHEDLRLPARLLAARRADSAPAVTLDEVATLLSKGECGQARELLDRIDGG